MSTGKIVFYVEGLPAPQGSKRHVGGGRMIEMSKKVTPWRKAVREAAEAATALPLGGPVELIVIFYLPRPVGHLGTGRNAGTIRRSAPTYPAVTPDLDKLLRSTCDAITEAKAWRDDSCVVNVMAGKRYAAPGMQPGAMVTIRPVGDM